MAWNKDQIVDLLLEAGEIALRVRRSLRFEVKADGSIVTPADHEIEKLISDRLENRDGGTFIIGEETVEKKGEEYLKDAMGGETYVVDPIDGTSPYAHHLPTWGVSIGRMEAGVLTDGAVYLPDFGEIFVSDGKEVLFGTQPEGARRGQKEEPWVWTALTGPFLEFNAQTPAAVTQALAKRGKIHLPNPVMVLGVAVVPMTGLLVGRFLSFLGSVKLWDVAGALPLLLRRGFSATVSCEGQTREVTARVDDAVYHLSPDAKKRWAFRSDLLVCDPEIQLRLRASFRGAERE